MDTRESTKRLQELAKETDRRCPQIGLFRKAKVPMVMAWYRAGGKRTVFEERFHIGRGRTPEERLIARESKKKR